MKNVRWMFALAALSLAALACQTLLGGARPAATAAPIEAPTTEALPTATELSPSQTVEATPADTATPSTGLEATTVASKFPLPDGATNVMDVGGATIFQVKMSLKDGMAFYRDALGKQGLKERTILTVTSDTTFSMVFDGDPSGKAIVIQGVDLGGGMINISLLLEDV